jgi:type IV secretory pathway TrbL component
MVDERDLPEKLLDLAIYAPVGLLLTVMEELPGLAERGRERVTKQVEAARLIGRLAVKQAEGWVGRAGASPAARTSSPQPPTESSGATEAAASPRSSGSHSAVSGAETVEMAGGSPSASATPTRRPGGAGAATKKARGAAGSAPGTTRKATPSGAAGALAIPGYDTLAASQVVQRLSSLRPAELEAVRAYEIANRGRRTILHRIGQLTTSGGASSD